MGERDDQIVVFGRGRRLDALDSVGDEVPRGGNQFAAEPDLARGDPRDVEQVIDRPGHVPKLPLMTPSIRRGAGLAVVAQHFEHLHGVGDGGQGVAQLVGEHRQELVLTAVVLLQLFLVAFAVGHVATSFRRRPAPIHQGRARV